MIGREMLGAGMPSAFAAGVAGFGVTVAAAGSLQSDAALIQTSMAIVTGADGTKGVVLLGGVEGDEVWIVNNSASTLKVYPPTGAAISVPGTGLGSANAAFLLTGNATFHGKFESTTQIIASSAVAYAEGVWTPTFTLAVPGNLTVSYSSQIGTSTRDGRKVAAQFNLVCTPTFTTGSGAIRVGGFPFTAASVGANLYGAPLTAFEGITKAGYSQFAAVLLDGTSTISLVASGSGVVADNVNATSIVSGAALTLRGALFLNV